MQMQAAHGIKHAWEQPRKAMMEIEYLEKQQGTVNRNPEESFLEFVHGFPGTRKSAVIKWMRPLMEAGLEWLSKVPWLPNSMGTQCITGAVFLPAMMMALPCETELNSL